MDKFIRTVTRNSAYGMLAQLAIKLLSFGFSVLIVRHLGVEAFGQYAAILAFGALFIFVADLGLSPYCVRQVARQLEEGGQTASIERLFGNLIALRLLLALLAAILLIGAAWLTGRPPVMVGAIALGTLGLLIYSFQGASDSMLAGYERLDLSARAKIWNQLIFVLAGALALWLGLGYYGLILANLLGIALMTLKCWRGVRSLKITPRRPRPGAWLGLLKASLPFGVIAFTLGLSYKFDSVVLNIFRGDTETGYYNAAYSLIFSTIIISNVLNTVFYPSMTRQAAADPLRLPAIYERALRLLLLIALPVAVGGWALAGQIIPFLYREAYLPAVPVLQIMVWVVPLMFASEFFGYVALVSGREREVARAVLVSTGLNVTFNLLLVPGLGLMAAAIMTVVTEAVLVLQYLWLLRLILIRFDWRLLFLRPLLAALLMGGQVLVLNGLPLLINIGLGAITYTMLLFRFSIVKRDEVSYILSLRRRTQAPVSN